MRLFTSVAELSAAVGEQLGTSAWHEVTQHQVDLFAEATGDYQWIHVDTARAARGPFGTTIAHGYLTLSMLAVLVPQTYRVRGLRMAVNYGLNKVRFPAPLPVGARVRAVAELVAVTASHQGHQVTLKVTVQRQGADGQPEQRPVCVAESLVLLVGSDAEPAEPH